jgi:hypothetical protein
LLASAFTSATPRAASALAGVEEGSRVSATTFQEEGDRASSASRTAPPCRPVAPVITIVRGEDIALAVRGCAGWVTGELRNLRILP